MSLFFVFLYCVISFFCASLCKNKSCIGEKSYTAISLDAECSASKRVPTNHANSTPEPPSMSITACAFILHACMLEYSMPICKDKFILGPPAKYELYMLTQTGELQSAVTLVLKRPSTGKIFTVCSRRGRPGRHEYRFRIPFCPSAL